MRKCIFFDADGTILDIKKGLAKDVPEAIAALNKQGHLTFLCTGRSRALLPKEVEDLPFSGMITNLGGYIEYNNKVFYNHEIPITDARRAVTVLRDCKMVPVMEGNQYMYYDHEEYTEDIDWYAPLITQQLGNRHQTIKGNEYDLHINKISAKFNSLSDTQSACYKLDDIFDYIHHEGAFVGSTIECIAKGISKGAAIEMICDHLRIPKSDRVGFGDSNNDLSMYEVVATKVAMGDASVELKEAATYVTSDMNAGGISQGLRYLGLI